MKIKKILLISVLLINISFLFAQDSLLKNVKWIYKYEDGSYNYFDTLKIDLSELGDYEGNFWLKNWIEKYDENKNDYSINEGKVCFFNKDSIITEFPDLDYIRFHSVGIINFSDHNDIFFEGFSGGNGRCPMFTNHLYLFNPVMKEIINLDINYCGCPELPMILDSSSNYPNISFSEEKAFLDIIKYHYGYVDSSFLVNNKENCKYANYYWILENDKIDSGKLQIQKYSAECNNYENIFKKIISEKVYSDLIRDNENYYIGFNDGVVEHYNTVLKQYSIMFIGHDGYDVISILKKYKDYLIIGTVEGELAVINLMKETVKRYQLNTHIETIEIQNDGIFVNEKLKIPVPEF
ncbi:MAG: hypothetical protein EHM58_20160 [Ignavibacteriae bacterium]|nr:MAG: hypothetical protein EHM58_20160 [Ignavibacteriota bacterium]